MENNITKSAKEVVVNSTEYANFVAAIDAKNEAVKRNQFTDINIATSDLANALVEINDAFKKAFYDEIFKLKDNEIVKTFIEIGCVDLYAVKNDSERGEGYVKAGEKMEILDIKELLDACVERQAPGNYRQISRKEFHMEHIDNLCHVIFAQKCKEMGIDPKSNKRYSAYCSYKVAKDCECNINTKTGITKAMQICFDSLVYVPTTDQKGNTVNAYKVDTRYQKALLANFSKWSNKSINGVSFPNYDTFRRMFMRIAHMVLTGKAIELD